MLVAAIGDAHLGRSVASPVTPEGVSTRELDFEISFAAAVETALDQSPDMVVWLGDIFDHPRPTYRSFRVAQRGLARFRRAGVRVAAITGNHDTPRLPGTGSPYSPLADAFPEFFFAHRLSYERLELPDLVVHAVPQMLSVQETLEALAQVDRERSLDRTNLLLTHPRLPQVEPRYADINEIEVDVSRLNADLVLLGHYHCYTTVRRNTWYAGSTDTFGFADEPEVAKGIVVLNTETGTCRHVPLVGQRPLVTLDAVAAAGLSPVELIDRITVKLAMLPVGAVGRLVLDQVDPEAYRLLDPDALRDAWAHALVCKIEPLFAGVTTEAGPVELDSLPSRWARYLAAQDLSGYDRDRVDGLGREYLTRAIEEAG